MTSERLQRLEEQLAALSADHQRLLAREAIRDKLYCYARGLDRLDRALLTSVFHTDAQVDYGALFQGEASRFVEFTLEFQGCQQRVHHMVGNILIELQGDEAMVESYELARHLSSRSDTTLDLVLAGRCIDRFALKDGQWRIAKRSKVLDWGRVIAGGDDFYAQSPLVKGRRDSQDASYRLSHWATFL